MMVHSHGWQLAGAEGWEFSWAFNKEFSWHLNTNSIEIHPPFFLQDCKVIEPDLEFSPVYREAEISKTFTDAVARASCDFLEV